MYKFGKTTAGSRLMQTAFTTNIPNLQVRKRTINYYIRCGNTVGEIKWINLINGISTISNAMFSSAHK